MLVDAKPELSDFITTWQGKPQAQVIDEISSYCIETQGSPDYYHYYFNELGELVYPSTNRRVKDFINRSHAVGHREFQLVEAKEDWLRTEGEGVIFWISPPAEGLYPSTKVTVSELGEVGGRKALLNRGILLEGFDQEKTIKLVEDLVNFCREYPLLDSLETIRRTPLIVNKSRLHWSYILEELVPNLNLAAIRTGEDRQMKAEMIGRAADLYKDLFGLGRRVDMDLMMTEVARSGMVGTFSTSCPVTLGRKTAFGFFSENAILVGGKEYFNCPKCKGKIESGKGITVCPHPGCGARKEDYPACD